MRALSVAALLSIADGVMALTQPTVTVLNGTLRGTQCPSSNANAFLSIPYANPPVGDLRFAPPQPYNQKFNGTLDATAPPPACVQFNSGFNESTPESEDCLFIDVWAPANATADSRLPVRAWLYGGSDEAGGISDALYSGCSASTDTIQVSINYRVGPLGWFAYQGLGLTGNYGLSDQLLGLQWVQDNIAAFGGDPTRVMLFGESAGAYDTWALSSLPQAKSLMHAAVLESGIYRPLANLTTQSQSNEPFLDALNCSKTDISCLRSTSADVLVSTFTSMNNTPNFYGLTLDGVVIPMQPSTPLVPSIIGSNSNEGSLFMASAFDYNFALNQTDYDMMLYENWTPAQAELINKTYPTSMFASSLFPVFETMSLVFTHAYFRCPVRQLLSDTAAAGVPVWTYSFNHTPSCAWFGGFEEEGAAATAAVLDALGATHTAELAFVFGQTSHLAPPNGTCSMTAAEGALSARFRAAWDAVAADAAPGAGWPRYAASGSPGVNIMPDASWEIGAVDYSMCDFWDAITGSITGATNTTTTTNGTGDGTGTGTAIGTGISTIPTSGAMSIASPWWANMAAFLYMLLALLFWI